MTGYHVRAADSIGHVEDFLFDDADWAVRYCVIDTSNWFGGRKVLVSPSWIAEINWGERRIRVDLQRKEIERSPPYDPGAALGRNDEEVLHRHYRRTPYWTLQR